MKKGRGENKKKNGRLLSWHQRLKEKLPFPKMHQTVFHQNTVDEEYDNLFDELEPKMRTEISDKLREEFRKRHVNLSNENIRGLAAEVVGECLKNSPCTSLNMSHNFLRDKDIEHLAKKLHFRGLHLEDLDLSNNRIGVEGAKVLAEVLTYNQSLRRLNLDTNAITGSGVVKLAEGLAKNTNLRTFSANWNNFQLFAEDFYLTLSKNKALHTLSLGYCSFGDQVAGALADGLKQNTALKELILFGNQITDEGAHLISSALYHNQSLTYLNMDNNLCSDLSAAEFIELIEQKAEHNQELCVNLNNNNLSEEMIGKLVNIRSSQSRKRTEIAEVPMDEPEEDDSLQGEENRKTTLNAYYNNRFYTFEEDQEQDGESDVDSSAYSYSGDTSTSYYSE